MKSQTKIVTLLSLLLLVGSAQAGDLYEVSAFMVFPTILNESTPQDQPKIETLVTITNVGAQPVEATLLFFDGDSCQACTIQGLDLPAQTGVTLVFTRLASSDQTRVQSLDGAVTAYCPGGNGFAAIYHATMGQPMTDNLLMGASVVVDYTLGSSYSVPPVVTQGQDGGDGNLQFDFDDVEYGKFPRIVAGNFFAPGPSASYEARLSLFTMGFSNGVPPRTRCSITGQDATGGAVNFGLFLESFEVTLLFGCWTDVDLREIAPEFGYPALGAAGNHEHGGIHLNCEVDSNNDGSFDVSGGVHGALAQMASAGTTLLERADVTTETGWSATLQQAVATPVAWGRLLNQSVTTGDSLKFTIEGCNGVDDDGDMEIDEGCDDDGDQFCDARLPAGAVVPPICPNGFGDCDDDDPGSFPGADEICDGRDNDCDGQIDEDVVNPPTWYADADLDGFGDPDVPVFTGCDPPAAAVADNSDCDDTDPTLFSIPDPIQNLILAEGTVLTWDSDAANSGSATEYDVLRGVLNDLPVDGAGLESCLAPAPGTQTTATDPAPPPPSGFYYVVRGRNACGVGTYGNGRWSAVCP